MKTEKKIITLEDGKKVEALAPTIVSASRATDIPAFYMDWFFDRLKAGYCIWKNPFNGKESYVSFDDTRFIVFWSKNPAPLIPYLHILKEKGIHCYVQFTLNDYEKECLEPNVPSLTERIETFKTLSCLLGKKGVIWRFDPMLLTDKIDIEDLLEKVAGIAKQLKDYTEKLVFSFADIGSYTKVRRNLKAYGVNYREWTEPEMLEFAHNLSELNESQRWGIKLATCGEKIDLCKFGIAHNRCVDDEQIVRIAWQDQQLMNYLGMQLHSVQSSLFGNDMIPEDAIRISDTLYAVRSRNNKASGQRKFCGCIESKDIGHYNTCPHGCLYCYANSSPSVATDNHTIHLSSTT